MGFVEPTNDVIAKILNYLPLADVATTIFSNMHNSVRVKVNDYKVVISLGKFKKTFYIDHKTNEIIAVGE